MWHCAVAAWTVQPLVGETRELLPPHPGCTAQARDNELPGPQCRQQQGEETVGGQAQ